MAEYIERQSVLAKKFNLESRLHEPITVVLASEIERIPAADVRPVLRGQWKHEEDTYFRFTDVEHRCSQCGKSYSGQGFCAFHFCPNCGADMGEAKT